MSPKEQAPAWSRVVNAAVFGVIWVVLATYLLASTVVLYVWNHTYGRGDAAPYPVHPLTGHRILAPAAPHGSHVHADSATTSRKILVALALWIALAAGVGLGAADKTQLERDLAAAERVAATAPGAATDDATRPVPVPAAKVVEKRVEVPVEKIVEKRVEVPVEKIVEVEKTPASCIEAVASARAGFGLAGEFGAAVAEMSDLMVRFLGGDTSAAWEMEDVPGTMNDINNRLEPVAAAFISSAAACEDSAS